MNLPFEIPVYTKSNTHKVYMKAQWKSRGIIFDGMFDEIYDIYIHCAECDDCKTPFKNSRDRQLDHNHDITDEYNIRNILCRKCHNNKKKQSWKNNTGEQYITKRWFKRDSKFVYQLQIRRFNKMVLRTIRRTLEDAIICRDEFIKENPQYF